jgi:23S rRNA G2069 N7-methylase RlmK/C1962 C5-methylase RlmI
MNFLRLPDTLLSTLFEDDDIIAIDKPYGFNAHTNDSKIEHSDFIQDGLIEMYEKQRGSKLHIIHRLDQTTTGVMIFGKSVESAKKYAEYFFNRQVKKTYLFITKYKSKKKSYSINQQIIHKAKELDAETDLQFFKKSENYELWQANPHTGRNHQIRIHSQAAGISILGDGKYDGHPFPFLCLHNHRIEFPNGIVLLSKPPAYFDDLSLLNDPILVQAFFEADRRERLFSKAHENQSYRLGHKDSTFTIEQFGESIVLTWLRDNLPDSEAKKFTHFAKAKGKRLVIHKAPKAETVCWVADENEVHSEIRSDSAGLLLNQRLHRNWVLNHSENKSVLNLFASTCTYGVVAALGKAAQVTSVEANKNALNWGRKNFELNKLDTEAYKFLFRDSLTFLEQSLNKKATYDLIICEAPAFFRREKGIFKIDVGLQSLLENCLQCLSAKGELLFATSYDGLYIDDIRRAIVQAQKKLSLENLEINSILPALDFELPNEKPQLKSFLIRIV